MGSMTVVVGEGPREAVVETEARTLLLPKAMEAEGVGEEVKEGVNALEALPPPPPPPLAVPSAVVVGEVEVEGVEPKGGEAVMVPPL